MTAPEITGAPKDRKRAPRLDGLRGYLALGVIVVHVAFAAGIIGFYDYPSAGTWAALAQGLQVLLPPFFVMSGLLLYRPFARATIAGTPKPSLGQYFLRRGLRILPGYWLVVVSSLLLLNLSTIDGFWYVARPLLTVHFYWSYGQTAAGLEPSWTVPAEIGFYLALPLLAWVGDLLARRVTDPLARARRLFLPLAGLVVLGFGWTVYTHTTSMGPYPDKVFWGLGFTAFLAIGMGLAVVAAYSEVTGRTPGFYRLVARHPLLFWLGALALYGVNCIRPFGKPGMSDYPDIAEAVAEQVVYLPFALLIIAPVVVPNVRSRFIDAVLTNPPMRFFGRISYGVYLWHFVIQYLWLRSGSVFGEPPQPMPFLMGRAGFWELLAVVLAGTIVVSTISYYFFELPAMRLRSRITRSSQEPAAGPVPGEAAVRRAA